MAERQLKEIQLSDIRENPVALHNVDRTSEAYIGLVDSIRKNGVLNAIVVRELKDPESGKMGYGLIDGLHRFSASQDAGKQTIPAQVISMGDAQVLETQILGNIHKIETKPVEYSRQLIRILAANPLMLEAELASKLSKSPTWLKERLGLTKLHEDIGKLVDANELNLSNAYALTKLLVEEQAAYLDRAMTMTPQEFVGIASTRAKEIKDAKRAGRDVAPAEFVPTAHVRKISELKNEMDNAAVGPLLVKELKITDPVQGFALGVKWALHMDAASIEAAKQKDAARKKEQEDHKANREKEKNDKKIEEANKKKAELEAKLNASPNGESSPKPEESKTPATVA